MIRAAVFGRGRWHQVPGWRARGGVEESSVVHSVCKIVGMKVGFRVYYRTEPQGDTGSGHQAL